MIQKTAEPGAREYVNLCTPTQTYQIRQVQSSNSLHILRPSDGAAQRGDINVVGENNGLDLVESMTSIAKCGSTLELHSPAEGLSAIPFLERSLEVYNRLSSGGDVDVDMDSGLMELELAEKKMAIEAYFADVPVSRAQCERDWFELCAFVSKDSGDNQVTYWRPSSRVKLDVWKRIVDGAVLQGIDLAKQFLAKDLWRSLLDDGAEEPFPRALFEAVLRRVCESEDNLLSDVADLKCESTYSPSVSWSSPNTSLPLGASLDKISCTRWVGETCLEAMAPTTVSAIGRSEFLSAWKDHLPESWRSDAALSKLTVCLPSISRNIANLIEDGVYQHPDPTSICFMDSSERQKVQKNLPTESGAAAKKTRNWHELFRNQR